MAELGFGIKKTKGGRRFVDVSLVGDKRLQKNLSKLALTTQKKIVRQVLRDHMKNIKKIADYLVPTETGALKASLRIRAIKRRRNRFGVLLIAGGERTIGKGEGKKRGLDAGSIENVFYASFVELGTDKKPAESFLRAAKDDYQPAFDRQVGWDIGNKIETFARSLKK